MKIKPNNSGNLNAYRQKQLETNLALVERSIDKLKELEADISFTSVSKMSFDIAKVEKGEKGLTVAAISKNETYSTLVNKAKAESAQSQTRQTSQHKHLSEAEIALEIYRLKSELAKLKHENKILKHTLANIETDEYPPMKLSSQDVSTEINELNIAMEGILGVLSLRKLIDIDRAAQTVKLRAFKDTLIDQRMFKKVRCLNESDTNQKGQ